MDYYFDVRDKTSIMKFNRKHLRSITHNEYSRCIRKESSVKNPKFFDTESKFTNVSLTTI